MKENIRKEQAITLIALVITIIVMLILVGVTLTIAIKGGLFDYAKKAVQEINMAMAEEQNLGTNLIEKYLSNNAETDNSSDTPEPRIVNTQNITINKSSLEESKTEQLLISEQVLSGGTWESQNTQVATVDGSGIVTWNSIGKTSIIYKDSNNDEEVFNLTCTYSIASSTEGWQVLHDCGVYPRFSKL